MPTKWCVEFKDDVKPDDIRFFTPNCAILFLEAIRYFEDNGFPMVVTSIKSDRGGIQTISTTHEDGRAFDVSSKGFSERKIKDVVSHFNSQFKNIGAISYSDLVPRAVLHHDSGYGAHFHFQVRHGARS
jgi:hypothetical protein